MSAEVVKFIESSDQWKSEIIALRSIMQKTKLEEEYKWNKPCYCFEGSNVVIIQPFKHALALMFFKGALLTDSRKKLVDNGPNSHSARRLELTSLAEIKKMTPIIRDYVKEAIELEKSGKKIEFKKKSENLPEELKTAFKTSEKFKNAFLSLTPGRQRGYILHFTGAKQSATRQSRIEKHRPRILAGKGLGDR